MLNQLIDSFLGFHWTEQIAMLTGLVYVILASRESIWCWPWGIISAALWAYATVVFYNLFIDGLLQLYYVVAGIVGLYQWNIKSKATPSRVISSLQISNHLKIISGGVVLSLIVGYLFANYTQAVATYLDALTTVFSLIATALTVYKVLENWIYWIVTDLIYVYIYSTREADLFAILMLVYTVVAIIGFIQWRRKYQQAQKKWSTD